MLYKINKYKYTIVVQKDEQNPRMNYNGVRVPREVHNICASYREIYKIGYVIRC